MKVIFVSSPKIWEWVLLNAWKSICTWVERIYRERESESIAHISMFAYVFTLSEFLSTCRKRISCNNCTCWLTGEGLLFVAFLSALIEKVNESTPHTQLHFKLPINYNKGKYNCQKKVIINSFVLRSFILMKNLWFECGVLPRAIAWPWLLIRRRTNGLCSFNQKTKTKTYLTFTLAAVRIVHKTQRQFNQLYTMYSKRKCRSFMRSIRAWLSDKLICILNDYCEVNL